MNLPRIDALDLRPPQPADPWDAMWDWPELPSFLKRRTTQYTFTFNVKPFMESLATAQAHMEAYARFGAALYDPAAWRYTGVFHTPWYRKLYLEDWVILGGIALAIGTCLGLLVDAWL